MVVSLYASSDHDSQSSHHGQYDPIEETMIRNKSSATFNSRTEIYLFFRYALNAQLCSKRSAITRILCWYLLARFAQLANLEIFSRQFQLSHLQLEDCSTLCVNLSRIKKMPFDTLRNASGENCRKLWSGVFQMKTPTFPSPLQECFCTAMMNV